MVNDSTYECAECMDGILWPRGECPECGPRFRKKGRLNSEERRGWDREVRSRISSSEFQELVVLARKSLSIPEGGWPEAEMSARLWAVHIAAWCNYCWSLDIFQKSMLPIKEEEARVEYLRPVLGNALAKVVAEYTMPKPSRAHNIDWLLCAKLIAARLCTVVGVDNVQDMFLYVLCPKSRNPESWRMKPIKSGQDPFRRQFAYFIQAVLPYAGGGVTRRPLKDQIDAAARATFDLLHGKITWDDCRRVYARAFPFFPTESTEALRVRATQATKDIPYDDILRFARSFFGLG